MLDVIKRFQELHNKEVQAVHNMNVSTIHSDLVTIGPYELFRKLKEIQAKTSYALLQLNSRMENPSWGAPHPVKQFLQETQEILDIDLGNIRPLSEVLDTT